MPPDDSHAPSFLLAMHENAHREHPIAHHEHLRPSHNNLHNRHTRITTATSDTSTVTEVTTTISVVQLIDVDSEGHTFTILTLPTSDEPFLTELSPPTPPELSVLTSLYSAALGALTAAANTASESSLSFAVSPPSQSPNQSALVASTSIPFTSPNFLALIASSTSPALISSSSSSSQSPSSLSSSPSFSSTTPSTISSSTSSVTSSTVSTPTLSFTNLVSSSISSPTSHGSSASSTLISSTPYTTTPFQSTSTESLGGPAGGTGVTSGTTTSSTAASGNGTASSSGSNVSTSTVVGGVVGSVAGVAFIAVFLLLLVRWKKNRSGAMLSLGSGRDGVGDRTDTAPRGPPLPPSGGMVEGRSFGYAVPAALASLTGYNRNRFSRQTDPTVSSSAGSERGFYRVSGRKLPSVLQSGGDGYGGGNLDDLPLSGTSFYRDSQGIYGGPARSPVPPLDINRESGQFGTPVMRPSPARTPVTEQAPFSMASPPAGLHPLPPRLDALGRSRPSQDGSHASRFTEEV